MFQLTANERKVLIGIVVIICVGAVLKYIKASAPRPAYAESGNVAAAHNRKTDVSGPDASAGNATAVIPELRPGNAVDKISFPVNVNAASQQELEQVPGIGPALARRIIEYRSAQGQFFGTGDLMKVKGIGRKKLEKIKDHICL